MTQIVFVFFFNLWYLTIIIIFKIRPSKTRGAKFELGRAKNFFTPSPQLVASMNLSQYYVLMWL